MVRITVRTMEKEPLEVTQKRSGIYNPEISETLRSSRIVEEDFDVDSEEELAEVIKENPSPESVDVEGISEIQRDEYDDFLDEIYPEVTIGSSTFNASEIIRELDPTMYEMGYDEYKESRVEDARSELEMIEVEGSENWLEEFFNSKLYDGW